MVVGEPEKAGREKEGCRRFAGELSAYLEGDAGTLVRSHADACPRCARLLADLEQIRSLAGDLPTFDPGPRVWANIRAGLVAEGVIRPSADGRAGWLSLFDRLPRLAPLGALTGLVILSLFFVSPRGLENAPGPVAAAETISSPLSLPRESSQEADLTRMLGAMEETYRARASSLDPALQAAYSKGLSSLDASIYECRRSIRAHPENALARQYLMDAYAVKAEVLASALESHGQ